MASATYVTSNNIIRKTSTTRKSASGKFPPTSKTLSHILVITTLSALCTTVTSYYHRDLVLDFLCEPLADPVFVRDVPWDCSSYVVCVRGRAIHSQCPGEKLYELEGRGRRCQVARIVVAGRCRGQIFHYLSEICRANPTIRIPSPDSCGQYFDCSAGSPTPETTLTLARDNWANTVESGWLSHTAGQSATPSSGRVSPDNREANRASGQQTAAPRQAGTPFVEFLLECPYPSLFSPDSGECADPRQVACRGRFEPKAPCEYLQYLQLYENCTSTLCDECVRHHPSCLSLPDGLHLVPGRQDFRMKCSGERTVDFITCPLGYDFVTGAAECARAAY